MAFNERKKPKSEELNLVPMMNLMTVLIPFLLSITAFSKIAVIEIALPKNRGSQTQTKQVKKPKEKKAKMNLTIIVSDQGITLGAAGGFLPTIFTKEKWQFKDENANKTYTIVVDSNIRKEMRANRSVMVPEAGRPMTMFERQQIILLAVNKESVEDVGSLVKSVHNRRGDLMIKTDFSPISLSDLSVGDTLINLTDFIKDKKLTALIEGIQDEFDTIPDMPEITKKSKQAEMDMYKKQKAKINYFVIVKDPSQFSEQSISAYDILLTNLLKIRERYQDAEDRDEIIISCEDQIVYDIVVNTLDIARIAGFTKLQMAKLRV